MNFMRSLVGVTIVTPGRSASGTAVESTEKVISVEWALRNGCMLAVHAECRLT